MGVGGPGTPCYRGLDGSEARSVDWGIRSLWDQRVAKGIVTAIQAPDRQCTRSFRLAACTRCAARAELPSSVDAPALPRAGAG